MRNKISSYVMQKKVWYNNVWKTGNLCNNKGCKWGKVMRKKKDDLSTKKQSNAGIYMFLIMLMVLLVLLIVYLAGIMFSSRFVDVMIKIPGVRQVTKVLVHYEEDGGQQKKIKKTDTTTEQAATTQEQVEQSTMLCEQKKVSEEYLKDAIFLGDSRTVAMVTYGFLDELQTLAEVGLCHVNAYQNNYTFAQSGLCYTMPDYLAQHQAKVVYLSYGINGIHYTDEDTYKSSYEELVDKVMKAEPDSKIVIQSIWPVKEGCAATAEITNAAVDERNLFLYELAQKKGIYYLDTQSILKNEYNGMKEEFNCGDGLHYNKEAYDAVFDYILTHPVPEQE